MGSSMDRELGERMAGPRNSLCRDSDKEEMKLIAGIGSCGQSKKQKRDFSEGTIPGDNTCL